MWNIRQVLGYVVEIDGSLLAVNLEEDVRSHVAGHSEGVSSFEQPGDLIAIEAGTTTLVARVFSLSFAEPRDLHLRSFNNTAKQNPLRQLKANVVGRLDRKDEILEFSPQTTRLPALGARVFPLSGGEIRAVLNTSRGDSSTTITMGYEARNTTVKVEANIDPLLSRHLAVLGATGQGKTHFVADVVQQLVEQKQRARIVVFDLNGEYYPAFKYLGDRVSYTSIGTQLGRNAPDNATVESNTLRIPYYALGRHGLFRLLLPSEKTQAPALRFAVEHLRYVEASNEGAKPAGSADLILFDDCRPGDATSANRAIETIRYGNGRSQATEWPHIRALSCLVAESYAIEIGRNGTSRNSFNYGHIQSLISRVNALITDPNFNSIIDVNGGPPSEPGSLNIRTESHAIVKRIFGAADYTGGEPSIAVIDLSQLAHDLMPVVLGPLLELFAEQLFRRGPRKTHPTLLVLEEAHHYLRQLPGDSETGQHSLAYERLAKEGRKFGLSLMVSTQRPSELSPTVLSQCGTWAVFRLTNELDKKAVANASEEMGLRLSNQLPGLARGEAMLFGSAFQLPVRILRSPLSEGREPDSLDPEFSTRWT